MADEVLGKVAIVLGADDDGFNAGFERAARDVEEFGQKAKDSAGQAVQSFSGMTQAAAESTSQMSAAQQRFLQSIERQVAALQGGKAAALEVKAAQLGLADAAAPMIAQVRELEQARRESASASDAAAAAAMKVAESEAEATARIREAIKASLDETAALQERQQASLRAATAAREASLGAGTGSGISIDASLQNRALQETADRVAEVNRALASIGRGASSQQELQAQTDKLVTLWSQGRISVEQYAAAVKQLDTSENSLTKASREAAAAADTFIAKLKEQAATAGMTGKELMEYRAQQLGVTEQAAPFIEQIAKGEQAMHGFSLQSSVARRELGVITRELGNGNFSGAARSFSIFAESSGLMATLLSPAVLTVGALAAGVGVLAIAYMQGQAEQKRFSDALVVTGNVAGTTAGGLHDLAVQAAGASGSLSSAKDVVLELASSGKLASDQIAMIATAAVEMESATGKAVRDTVKEFEELGKAPVDASIKLNEQYHYLTQAIFDQISALERQGNQHAAAELAERAYADALRDRAKQITENIGTIEAAWRSAKNAAQGFWDTVMNQGRSDLLEHDIAEYEKRLATPMYDDDRKVLEARVKAMKETLAIQKQLAQSQSDDKRTEGDSIAASRAIDQQTESIDKNIRKRNELARLAGSFTKLMLEAQRTGIANDRLDGVIFSEDGAPVSGGLFSQLQKDIEDRYKERTPRATGTDNALNSQIETIKGQLQEEQRALKLTIDGNKAQYDIGLLDTQAYLTADYEARKAALQKEQELARQQKEIAGKKKNTTALVEAQNQQRKLHDEEVANEQKYINDMRSLQEKSRRDVEEYVKGLNASYRTREQAINNLIAGAGLSDSAKDELNRLNQVQQEFDRAAESLRKSKEKGEAHGGISQEQYAQELQALQDSLDKRLELERGYSEQLRAVQQDGWLGATRYMRNYQEAAANVASQVETVFGTAARGMEDAWANFVTTGKLNFSDLAKSVVADIARMQARAAVSGLFSYAISAATSFFGGGASEAAVGSGDLMGGSVQYAAEGGFITGPGTSTSDDIPARLSNGEFVVNADATMRNRELLEAINSGGETPVRRFAAGGYVSAARGMGQAYGSGMQPNIQVTTEVHIHQDGTTQSTTSTTGSDAMTAQLADGIRGVVVSEIGRQMRQGGIIWKKSVGMTV